MLCLGAGRGATLTQLPLLPPLGETSQTALSPGGGSPSPTAPLPSWWCRGWFFPTPWFFITQKDHLLEICFTLYLPSLFCILSPVGEVCGHVGLGVNDLGISTIILKRDNCCTAGQKWRKSVLSSCTDNIEHFQKGQGELWISCSLS